MAASYVVHDEASGTGNATDDRGSTIIIASAVTFSFSVLAVILRIAARYKRKVRLAADDWWIFGALFFCACYLASTLVACRAGLGRHIWTVTDAHMLGGSLVSCEMFYAATVVPIKISMLYLYRSVFPSRQLYWTSVATAVFICSYSLAQIVAMGLQCIPLSALWTNEPAQCIDLGKLVTVMGSLNIFTDIVIIVLPVPQLWGLKLNKMTRLGLLFTFALGSLTVIFSLLRTIFVGSASIQDPSWNDTYAAMYSSLELNLGVVSACLPTLRPLFFRGRDTSGTGSKSRPTDSGLELTNRPRPRSTINRGRNGWNVMEDSPGELRVHKSTTISVQIEDQNSENSSNLEK